MNQSKSITQEEKDIQDDCDKSKEKIIRAILIVHFKMKYKPKLVRETTVKHDGKRGIGLQGYFLVYDLYQQKKTRINIWSLTKKTMNQ